MFLLKKCVSQLFFPLPLVVLLLTAGTIALWTGKKSRLARYLITLGTGLLVFFSSHAGSNLMLRSK